MKDILYKTTLFDRYHYLYESKLVFKDINMSKFIYNIRWRIIKSLMSEGEKMEIKMAIDNDEKYNYTMVDRGQFSTKLWS